MGARPTPDAPHRHRQPSQRAGSRGWERVQPRTPHTGPGSPPRGRTVGGGRAPDPGRPTPAPAAHPEGGQSGVGERPTPDASHRPRQPAQRASSPGWEYARPRTPHTGPSSPPRGRAVGGGRAPDPGRPTPAPAARPEGGQSGVGERLTLDAPHRPRQPAQRAGSRGWESVRPRTPHTGPGSPPRGQAVGGWRAPDPGRPTPALAARPEGGQSGVGERLTPDAPHRPRQPAQRAGSRGWESVRPRTPHTSPGSPPRGRAVGGGRAPNPGRPTPGPAARPEGGQSGVGGRPTTDAPHRPQQPAQRASSRGWESARPRAPHTGPGSPLRGRAVGGRRASDPGRPTPAPAARPESEQSGLGEPPTPDAPHQPRQPARRAGRRGWESVRPRTPHTGPGSPPRRRAVGAGRAPDSGRPKAPPPGTPYRHPHNPKPSRGEPGPDRPPPSTPDGARDRGRTCRGVRTTWNGPTSAQCRDHARCARHTTPGGGGADAAGARAHTHERGTRGLPEGQPDRARGTHRPRGMAYQRARVRDTRTGGPPHAARDTRGGMGERRETQHQVPARTPRTGRERRAHTDGALHSPRQ